MKQKSVFRWQRLFLITIIAALTIGGVYLLSSNYGRVALATDDNASQSETSQITVQLTKTGYTTGTSASLDKAVGTSGEALYTATDHVILKWSGVATGNDFVIPVSVKYGNVTKSVSDLINNSNFQTINTEYKRRMGSTGAIAEYDTIKTYLTKEHSVDLGTAVNGSTVTIEFMRVSPVYRMYNMITSEHLFSTNKQEYDNFVLIGKSDKDAWVGEGVNWLAPQSSTTTVQRLYNDALGSMGHSSHYYTSNTSEMDSLINQHGWKSDGSDNSFGSSGDVAIYTCYNEGLGSAHHYTSSRDEWLGLEQHQWALERDKNEPNGNFNGILGTAWSFTDNFYTVKHSVQNLDGTFDVYSNQVFAGVANSKTSATALTIPGFKAGSVPSATISDDNSTTINIEYTRESYALKFDTQGGSTIDDVTGVSYGAKLTAPSTKPVKDGKALSYWSYDAAGKYPVDFTSSSCTMPVGGITLYAMYESKTGNDGNTFVVDPEKGNLLTVNVTYDDNGTAKPLVGASVEIKDGGSIQVIAPSDVATKTIVVTVSDTTGARSGISVNVLDVSGSDRGTKTTSTEGTATFEPTQSSTDQNGQAIVIDPSSANKQIKVTVKYNEDDTTSTSALVALIGASVEIDKTGNIVVNAPANAASKTISVDLAYTDGSTLSTRSVSVYDSGNTDPRGTKQTTSNNATFAFYNVTFDTQGGNAVDKQKVYENGKVTKPQTDPTREGAQFKVWATDKDGTTSFDFESATIISDTTIYATWSTDLYTVVLHANGGVGEDVTITRVIGDEKNLEANPFTKTSADNKAYGMSGWAKGSATSTEIIADRYAGDLTTTVGDTVDLYAQWTTETVDTYWIAPASKITTGNSEAASNNTNEFYSDPLSGVVKTRDQIQQDVQKIKDNDEATVNEYKEWLNKDNMHLYTKLNGVSGENSYVEMRIIQVGEHLSVGNSDSTDKVGDGTALTFQAIHAMPMGFATNSNHTSNAGGWASSELRINMNSHIVLQSYNTTLTNDIKPVSKWNKPEFDEATKMTTTNDSLWILSASEIGGSSAVSSITNANKEGEQYDYWKQVLGSTSASSSDNVALQSLGADRSGSRPGNNSGYWWTRTVGTSSTTFLSVNNKGAITANETPVNTQIGTVPAFAFGSETKQVTFDTQNESSKVDSQTVAINGYASTPKVTPTSKDAGYVFKGWYKSADENAEVFDFDKEKITQDTIVYAQYEPGDVDYSVEVYLEGETQGEYPDVPSKTVKASGKTGEQTNAESIEVESGYEIDSSKAAVNTTITGDGKAIAKIYLKRSTYALKFNKMDLPTDEQSKLTSWPEDVAAQRYGTSYVGLSDPYSELYVLEGWYLDADRTVKFDATSFKMPAADTTIYAKWTKNTKHRYTANFYTMKEDGNYNTTIEQTKIGLGEIGENTETTQWANLYEGYHIDTTKTETKQISADGTTTISVYFARNKVTVTYVTNYGENGKLDTEQTLHTTTDALYGAKLSDPTKGDSPAITPTARGLSFDSWLQGGFDGDENASTWNFDTDTVPVLEDGANIKLYAKWKGKELWIGPASIVTTGKTSDKANQRNPEYNGNVKDNIKKTSEELYADVAVLKAGENANNTKYAEVKAEYEKFMNDDNFHLYTNWVGSTVDSSEKEQEENKYLEFRIIHVGDHDGDGSVLTFQMTHLAPTAFRISDSDTTTNGWESSPLRAKIGSFAPVYEAFTGEFQEIEKKCFVAGAGSTSDATTSTKDKFWLTSIFEMIPTFGNSAYEGTQYAWYKDKVDLTDLVMKNKCPAIAFKTRAGNYPLGASQNDCTYWTRTPDRNTTTAQSVVSSEGQFYSTGLLTLAPNESAGVVIAFAL